MEINFGNKLILSKEDQTIFKKNILIIKEYSNFNSSKGDLILFLSLV